MRRPAASLMLVAAVMAGGCSSAHQKAPVIVARPVTYRVVYDVTTTAAGPPVHEWEELAVRRPFDVWDAHYAERPVAGHRPPPQTGTLTSTIKLYDLRPNGVFEVAGREPGPGTADQALLPFVNDAVERGLAQVGQVRTIAGRICQDERLLEPPAGVIKPLGSAGHDDLCLDGEGLILREAWALGGKMVLLRQAVEVDTSGAGLDQILSTAAIPPAADSLGPRPDIMPVDAAAHILPTPPVPPGFEAHTAVGFHFPDLQNPGADLYRSTVWNFTRGPDVITVEAGTGAPGFVPWASDDTSRGVELTGLGHGEIVLRSDGAEIRVALSQGRWVRVRGTVALIELISYARSVPGPVS